ncbi:N-glycosylation protein eos1 [Wickerhamomyces ciferrii]|uniref:N-glycosylation protein eos1 n=1 Tax=Wickerhamomyces ciferrii (strain ATCC 14091 / BCRC 22168 / CBS 111 / JCM 3599 / NBRC 0793 / NRRL Y-1031 F-60-10) TaxID=1206466 RepID=K0KD89_WICCF|nr:N-glycosylation protein eos1 [Wickerhamomyces ciferrii]CCH43070.1 N-glycosylation protein eos1 [Wickerhamomyces ciferrii]
MVGVRQRFQDVGSVNSNQNDNYADRPPRTPSPGTVEYPAYQEMRVSHSTSSLQRAPFSNGYHRASYRSLSALDIEPIPSTEERVPSYEEIMNQDQQNLESRRNSHDEQPLSEQRTSISNERRSLKILGLNFLNAKQHFALAICRDSVLIPSLYNAFKCFKNCYHSTKALTEGYESQALSILKRPSSSEEFIAGIWCVVAAYLSFAVIDGLMVRWIVTYQTGAAILRVLALSMLLITMEQATLAILSPDGFYLLHTWVLISCILTGAYIIQNFVTSNLDLKNGNKPRSVDYYNITVFAVVPIGIASFISMIALLRILLILRLDLEREKYGLRF